MKRRQYRRTFYFKWFEAKKKRLTFAICSNKLWWNKLRPYHIWPLGACRDTWLLYWKAGCSLDNTGSCKDLLHLVRTWRENFVSTANNANNASAAKFKIGMWRVLTRPTTPRPRTVSRVPDRLKILQCLSLSWTTSLPMFSRRMQYRHCRKYRSIKPINSAFTRNKLLVV